MKRFVFSISLVLFASALLAQAPQAINYQAVARDAAGNLIANQAISFRLTILQGGPTGTVVYSETHLEISNQFGLVTMEIGWGTVISGVFANISWGTSTYYLKTEMDPAGGTAYQEMGTSQFISVPYAFWADTEQYARDGIPGPPGPPGPGTSCGMDVCYDGRTHQTGYYTNITINNDLIIPESFIQLTVQRITQHLSLFCTY